ncbi:MAG: HAD family phosphatase [Acidobacteriaceae bacterium]|jgi:putative hydrolase of the HAD superfamily|nr:HAD family phosphatase [Acidobacteriaceae bacterium]
MTEIKTIYFDIGGVLLSNGFDEHQRAHVLPQFGVDLADYETRHPAANHKWERGLCTAHEYFNETLFYKPRDFGFDEIWAAVKAQSAVLHPGCFDIVAELQAVGRYRLCTLNNESRELNDYRLQAFGLTQYFDTFICSGYVNEMKPHPNIYRSALELTQAAAEQSVFIDDREENLTPARALGMKGIRLQYPEQLREDLLKLGVTTEQI